MFKKVSRTAPGRTEKSSAIIVVSGLPRSGTSMMMKMLAEGGLEPVTDALRRADEDNPNGYFEFEPVKQLADGQDAWLDGAGGKLVKVISALLEHLPARHQYKVVFMEREIKEILASQQKMLQRRNEASGTTDEELEVQVPRAPSGSQVLAGTSAQYVGAVRGLQQDDGGSRPLLPAGG